MALIKCPECGKEISDKATSCPNCGAPVSNQNNTGAPVSSTKVAKPVKEKKKGSCLKTILIVIAVLLVLGIIGNLIGGDKENETNSENVQVDNTETSQTSNAEAEPSNIEIEEPETIAEPEEILEIAPGDLLDSYEANEVKGDAIYENKKMRITGVISSIGKDVLENVYITFEGNNKYSITSVQCFFSDDSEIEKVMELNQGDTITIVGVCDGKFGNVTIKDCIIE